MKLSETQQLSITRIFRFEMAHILYNHGGKCRNIHGHSYELHVCIGGRVLEKPGDPADGMIMDFTELKQIVQQHVISKCDHAMAINTSAPYTNDLRELSMTRLLELPFQPSCENLIRQFACWLVPHLPEGIQLKKLRLYETANSYAEWEHFD